MSPRSISRESAFFTLAIFLCTTFAMTTMVGCASTPPETGPGAPDAAQLQHWAMLQSAIDSKSKTDALAALKLLDADVSRWQTHWRVSASAMYDQESIKDAVNKDDWALANTRFLALKSKYGRP